MSFLGREMKLNEIGAFIDNSSADVTPGYTLAASDNFRADSSSRHRQTHVPSARVYKRKLEKVPTSCSIRPWMNSFV